MEFYLYIAIIVIFLQLLFSFQITKNYRYVLSKSTRKRQWYRPKSIIIIPCKGIDTNFEENISSFFMQDYEVYQLWFVVEDRDDPAYEKLCELVKKLKQNSKAINIQIQIAGITKGCSQKVHNLLYCYKKIPEDTEVMAFADSDICIQRDWLSHIVYPLRKSTVGVASGYRWFVPKENNLASLALSCLNAKIAQLLGNTIFNHVWGGSMAIQVNTFKKLKTDEIWSKSLSDDLSISIAAKKAGLKIVFVPACLAASYETTTWKKLFEFARRQFLITRVYAPKTWLFGLWSSFYSVMGLLATVAVAIYAGLTNNENLLLFIAIPIILFAGKMYRAILRQKMIVKLLKKDAAKMKAARIADIYFFWVWSVILLFFIVSSAFGKTITWRTIRYKLVSPTKTKILNK